MPKLSKDDDIIFTNFYRNYPNEVTGYPKLRDFVGTFADRDYDTFTKNAESITATYFPSKTDNPLVQLAVDMILPDYADYYRSLGYTIPQMSRTTKSIRGIEMSKTNSYVDSYVAPSPLIEAIKTNSNNTKKIIPLIDPASSVESFPVALASGNIPLINLMIRRLNDYGEMSEDYLTSNLDFLNKSSTASQGRKLSAKQIAEVEELLIEYGADVFGMSDTRYVNRHPFLKKQLDTRKVAEGYDFAQVQAMQLCETLSNENGIKELRKIAMAMAVRVRSFKTSKYLSKSEVCAAITENIGRRTGEFDKYRLESGSICETLSNENNITELRKIATAMAVPVKSFETNKYLSKGELCVAIAENIGRRTGETVKIGEREPGIVTPTFKTR